MSVYDYKVNTLRGQEVEMSDYRNKVLLIVNTASKCGLTRNLKAYRNSITNSKTDSLKYWASQVTNSLRKKDLPTILQSSAR